MVSERLGIHRDHPRKCVSHQGLARRIQIDGSAITQAGFVCSYRTADPSVHHLICFRLYQIGLLACLSRRCGCKLD